MKTFCVLAKNFFFIPIIIFACAACISTYHRYEKLPCSQIGEQNRNDIKTIILANGFKEKDVILTEKSVQYRKKIIEFSEISKVVVVTKGTLKGKRYTLVTTMKSRQKHAFETHDYKLAISVYSALECLAGIEPKPAADKNVPTESKYTKLEKLKSLLDSGAITAEEYEKEKKKVLEEN
jgi:hypothetical protein